MRTLIYVFVVGMICAIPFLGFMCFTDKSNIQKINTNLIVD